MKQSTKVLLPLGLFMSIVIPITVKSMFSESNLFEADNSSSNYTQPYMLKPESEAAIPKIRMGDKGLELEVIEASVATQGIELNSNNSSSSIRPEDNGKMSPPDIRSSGNQNSSNWSRSSR